MLVIYTNDTILTGPNPQVLRALIQSISSKFNITSADAVNNFLGVNINQHPNGTIHLTLYVEKVSTNNSRNKLQVPVHN
jgi:hypothetical protein